jgi:hypothetical protein
MSTPDREFRLARGSPAKVACHVMNQTEKPGVFLPHGGYRGVS